MRSQNKARQLVPVFLAIFLLSVMVSRGRLQQIRTVDALSLFAAGMACGVALVNLVKK